MIQLYVIILFSDYEITKLNCTNTKCWKVNHRRMEKEDDYMNADMATGIIH